MANPGGLATHSYNVLCNAMKIADALGYTDTSSVVISALLHDLGKIGDYGKKYYIDNILKSGKPSPSKPYKRNPNILEMNHAVKSVVLANRYIDLTENEEYAILHHDGLYEVANREAMNKPTPLLLILHYADLWASHVQEDKIGGNDDE